MEENKTPAATEEQQPKGNKIDEQYNDVILKLTAALGGDDDLKKIRKKVRVPNDQVAKTLQKVMKDREAKALETFEKEATTFMDELLEYDASVTKAREDFEKAIQDKKKAFIEKAKKLFAGVENIDNIKSTYLQTLRNTTNNA